MTSKSKVSGGNYHSNTAKETKLTYQMLEQEKNMLKITLDYMVKDNDNLKQQLEDMKMTVKHNKELLKEYVEKITNKDKVVEKMNATIDQLTARIQSLEEYIKQINKKTEKRADGTRGTPSRQGNPPIPLPMKNADLINSVCEGRSSGKNSQTTPTNVLTSENNSIPKVSTAHNVNSTNNNSNQNTGNVTISTSNVTNVTRNTSHMTRNNSDFGISQKNKKDINESVIGSALNSLVLPSAKSVNKQVDDKVKEFFLIQSRIIEEMNILKDDMQFILENKKKSKLTETLQQSYRSMNNSMISDTSSINLNNSVISHRSSNTINMNNNQSTRKYNLKEKFNFDVNMVKFQEFLSTYNPSRNILLFVDSKNNFWELIKRNDLNMNILANNCENIVSATSGMFTNKFQLDNAEDSPKSKLLNIEIKDYSLNNSELDISKVTDYNFLRELNEN